MILVKSAQRTNVVVLFFFYFTDLNVGASYSSDAHNVEKKTDVDFRNSQTIRPNIISIVADSKKEIFFSFHFSFICVFRLLWTQNNSWKIVNVTQYWCNKIFFFESDSIPLSHAHLTFFSANYLWPHTVPRCERRVAFR